MSGFVESAEVELKLRVGDRLPLVSSTFAKINLGKKSLIEQQILEIIGKASLKGYEKIGSGHVTIILRGYVSAT